MFATPVLHDTCSTSSSSLHISHTQECVTARDLCPLNIPHTFSDKSEYCVAASHLLPNMGMRYGMQETLWQGFVRSPHRNPNRRPSPLINRSISTSWLPGLPLSCSAVCLNAVSDHSTMDKRSLFVFTQERERKIPPWPHNILPFSRRCSGKTLLRLQREDHGLADGVQAIRGPYHLGAFR